MFYLLFKSVLSRTYFSVCCVLTKCGLKICVFFIIIIKKKKKLGGVLFCIAKNLPGLVNVLIFTKTF